MSSRGNRSGCGQWQSMLATTVRPACVASIVSLACIGILTRGWADELGRGRCDSAWGVAALELQRLPPTTAPTVAPATVLPGAADRDSTAPANAPDQFARSVSTRAREAAWLTNDAHPYGTRLYLGYDRGFVIAADQGHSGDAATADFLMRVNSWFHFRHAYFSSEGPHDDQNTFSFERLRLSFAGHVLTPDLEYFMQLDANSDSSTNTIFLDYFTTYDFGHHLFGGEPGRMGLKLGKWKVPFSRSREESGRRLQFADRAIANIFFDLNRSIGIGLTSRLDAADRVGPLDGPMKFETAVFNGWRTGSVATNRSEELDRNFGWSCRGHVDLLDKFGADGEPDLAWHDEPSLRIGSGLAVTRNDAAGATEFSRQRVVDSGQPLPDILPPAVTAYDAWLYTVDAHFKYHGFSLIGEYYWRTISRFKGADVPSLLDDGFVLQSGYFVIAEKLELIGRWSRIKGDSGTLGQADASSDELGAGFVWYIRGHNAKLTVDISHYNGVPISSSRLELLPGDAGWLSRTQFQLAF